MIEKIDQTIEIVNQTLDKITAAEIDAEYPMLVFEEKTSTEYFLVHLTTHLAYHLGQINYHRRLLDVIIP
ncbi:DinB family protein [Pedobacter kyungheensis]|uniref:DinB family protein n=1 Tax=Pedobacter kyungheensis TaxID=1069985 RepID=UPI000ACDD776|nr:DinB family protein [Pedobacter kyungheensis]